MSPDARTAEPVFFRTAEDCQRLIGDLPTPGHVENFLRAVRERRARIGPNPKTALPDPQTNTTP